jgi:hypothetical protein
VQIIRFTHPFVLKHPFEICSILASILIIPIWILDTSVLETVWMMGQEWLPEHTLDWVIPEKIHPAPKEGISAVQMGRGEHFCF